jgi:hypothetical protein
VIEVAGSTLTWWVSVAAPAARRLSAAARAFLAVLATAAEGTAVKGTAVKGTVVEGTAAEGG